MTPEDAADLSMIVQAEEVCVLATEGGLDWRVRMPTPAKMVTITIYKVDDTGPGNGTT